MVMKRSWRRKSVPQAVSLSPSLGRASVRQVIRDINLFLGREECLLESSPRPPADTECQERDDSRLLQPRRTWPQFPLSLLNVFSLMLLTLEAIHWSRQLVRLSPRSLDRQANAEKVAAFSKSRPADCFFFAPCAPSNAPFLAAFLGEIKRLSSCWASVGRE